MLDWALEVVRQVVRSVSLHEVSYCLLLLHCSLLLHCPCFAHCRHDPIIVRTASNFSTFPRFHSVCASVSMFMINMDQCLFQFLCSCLRVCSLGDTPIVSSHQVSVRLFRVATHRIHHRLRQPSSCSGVWDPWPHMIPILQN